jgi:serine/threonine-protein kinase
MSEQDGVDSFAQTMVSGSGDQRDVTTVPDDLRFEGERYRVERVLGVGGMGEVRLCADAWIGRDVAMKVAKAGQGSAAETRGRFLREARVQGQLEHPNVVPVYDVGLHRGETFFTMKRIGGHTLEEIVRGLREGHEEIRVKYNRRKLLSAMSQVCLTIAYAHSRGVIHRDLKPANVMLGDFGEVYVLDWGVAKLAAAEEAKGAVIGTPGYMPPEQLAGESVGPRSDVYALGAILFELLALEPMCSGTSLSEVVVATSKPADAPSTRAPSQNVAPELDTIVLRAVEIDPAKRFESARAMHEAIEAFLDGERDAERRRSLASEHVKKARAALARASDPNEDAEARRAEGMRELGRAVALDPSDAGALRAISELVLAPATDLPKAAIAELRAGERADRAKASGRASRMYLAWLALVPLLYVMGIRSWPAVIALGAMILAASAWTFWVSTKPKDANMSRLLVVMLVNCALVGTCSLIFGPFVFVPGVAASSAAAFVLAVRDKTWMRYVPFTLATLAVFVPVILELAGLMPAPYTFADGTITIHPVIADFRPAHTVVSFGIVTLVQMILPAVVINRAVDNLVDAERRSFAQAWRLRQLLP